MLKNPPASAGDMGLVRGSVRFPGEENGNPLQSVPGKSHGQRSLTGYSLWSHKSQTQFSDLTTTLIISSFYLALKILCHMELN